MKQVVIMHYTLPPVVGGVETILGPFAEIFAENGYLVTMLTGEGKVENHNIKTCTIPELSPNHPAIRNIQRVLKMGSLPENYEHKLSIIQRKIEAEIGNIGEVVIHNMLTMPYNLIATEALWNYVSKNPQKKFYVWVHDIAWAMDEYKKFLYNRRPWILLKTSISGVKYITISEMRKRQLSDVMGISKKEITVVPNAIKYSEFFKFCKETERVLDRINFSSKYPFILSPVRFLPRKNIEKTIEIISVLSSEYPNALCLITGNVTDDETEEYYIKIKKLVEKNNLKKNVLFLFEILNELGIPADKNREIVRDLYFVTTLVLITSNDEGFGIPLLEAGLSRAPIAVSSIPVFREITKEGIIYLPLDESPEYNAKRIIKVLSTTQNKATIFHNQILTRFDAKRYWDLYLKEIFSQSQTTLF
ncbi:MAG: hypothetical protein DRP92_00825 [Candidatus Neomarinimicrobiota bacterium]|nr:MAG: hypothetical protein DRP88_08980 [Candidatus Neomarinimicrobiota bacterium]RKY54511.1 MAG: hypothetical protein DRP92_00825 [Candidatus Neomarinimicrobiota bacterium]